ncbi:sulfurtransferase-like selenium metabolism protein YedF [Pelosinus sp. sgz500959]|uniref:sulfurtransferase-like selenium metabolism protein YedF n=1 Tax=Pelosinus sp. sgz500959 TaxID=3242472 RepID=UPI003672FA84
MSINIDARGLACPQPVIATKKALEGITDGVVTILVDNMVSKENVVKFSTAHGCGVSVINQDGNFLVKISKGAPMPEQAVISEPVAGGHTVYVMTQDTLGKGKDELGAVLMKGFIYTLLEIKPLPKAILFMNGGILLTIADSPVIENLKKLEQAGIEILSCGTCLDYFAVKDKLAVGGITNMYTIVEMMSAASKVITL